MTLLRLSIFSLCLTLSYSAFAQTSEKLTLEKNLKVWQPTEISNKNKIITVVLPGKNLTPEAYESIVTGGICMPIWTKDAPNKYLENIKELSIVNQYKMLGFTIESPASTCAEMGKLMDKPGKTYLASKTRMYMPAK